VLCYTAEVVEYASISVSD